MLKYKETNANPYTVKIKFCNNSVPDNIRVYELKSGKMQYDKRLVPDGNLFVDDIKDSDNISLRAYIFDKDKRR